MTKERTGRPGGSDRADRLKAALKANMSKRKAQARARAAQAPTETKPRETEGPKR
ncbi:hypothetical protein [Palleronia aestuarii]|uniref:hypothetical protein n=1 Tax=Palleronia aestuarii TaxID=568105 RepID=UPI001472E2C3|nr:hypothetical protein [Palleronia aestuarii]